MVMISEETRKRMREAHLGLRHTPEEIEKIRLANLGKSRSVETRRKISTARKDFYKTHQIWNKGIPCSDSQKRKISIASKGRRMDDAFRDKCRNRRGPLNPFFGKTHSEVSKALMSKAHKGRPNPFKGIPKSLEHIRHYTESIRKYHKEHGDDPVVKEQYRLRGIKATLSVKPVKTLIERTLCDALSSIGLKFTCNEQVLGQCIPDIVFSEQKIAIFADGCYWHGCPLHYPVKNKVRDIGKDARQVAILSSFGWTALRYWEHDLENESLLDNIVNEISSLVLAKTSITVTKFTPQKNALAGRGR